LSTVVLEGGEKVGGLCILRGCMPTKALLASSDAYHFAKHASIFGVHSKETTFNVREIYERKDKLIQEFADYRQQQLEDGRFAFIRAKARFLDPFTLELDDGKIIKAQNFVVATGSLISPPPLADLEEVGYLTSDDSLHLKKLPRSLIVLGGGAVAVEAAQYFCRLGVAVTLIQRHEHILKESDDEAAEVIEHVFRREGMTVYTGTHLVSARKANGQKYVSFHFGGQVVEVGAEEIFFGLGRIPNIANIGLEKAGITLGYGRFLVNSEMQTNVPHIYAAGDCTGLYEVVHIAIQQGEIAAHNIIHPNNRRHIDYRLLISIIFTEPQVAQVGLTEKLARQEKIPHIAASYPFGDHGKSMLMETRDGFVKLLADPASGEIIGGACVGPHGGELIHEIVAAMYKRMTVRELASMPHYHPTLAEIWTYPAEELADIVDQQTRS
ncbi:MAG: dihydrolipoyl dehydrogenase family protein, partial [Verrucomicrobiales bacterium]